MEFKQAMKIWARMCESSQSCMECPIVGINGTECRARVSRNPDKYEDVFAKWAAEHPEKTIADDFFEKHPRAPRKDGHPLACALHCGYMSACADGVSPAETMAECRDCWRRPLEEVE